MSDTQSLGTSALLISFGWNNAPLCRTRCSIQVTGTVVTPASHGTVSSYTTGGDDPDTFTYTPNNGFRGEDFFTFTMSDGETASEEKTVRITVK